MPGKGDAIGKMLGEVGGGNVHQLEPLTDEQIPNSEGGYVWEVDDAMKLRRFLCLGTEGGSFYAGEPDLTVENAQTVTKMITEGRGLEVVETVTEISTQGRAAKQNPTIFCLALCARYKVETKTEISRLAVQRKAYEVLPKICRIPTHLFMFADYCEKISGTTTGWGRSHRTAIGSWYLSRDPSNLAFAITKYPQRNGWSHRDMLRLAHPDPKKVKLTELVKDETEKKEKNEKEKKNGEESKEEKQKNRKELEQEYDDIFHYACKGYDAMKERQTKRKADDQVVGGDAPGWMAPPVKKWMKLLEAVEDVKKTDNVLSAAWIVRENNLVREHVPTLFLNELEMWKALSEKMPMTAMIRNLNKMTVVGLLTKNSDETTKVVNQLTDEKVLHKAMIHPFNVLLALHTYKQGKGDKGKLTWEPVPQIVDALEAAFYKSFKNVQPIGQRILMALDVSGSMTFSNIMGSSITPRVGSSAMATIALKTEEKVDCVAFQTKLTVLPFDKTWTMDKIMDHVDDLPFGGTDCAQPMLWAMQKKKVYDLFIVYTDSETYFGQVHPTEALRKYRRKMKIPHARLIVVGMVANKFSIADPNDPGMLDIAGFDSAAPEVMRNFALGLI